MKINQYAEAEATHFENEVAKGVAARVVIGKKRAGRQFFHAGF